MSRSSDHRLPRYQLVRDDLAARIAHHEWRAGDAIPSEAELSRAYSIAIGTVRKAIDQLVAEGVLDRQQGRGTFVRKVRFNSSLFRFFRFQSEQGERRIPESRIIRRETIPASSDVASALRLRVDEPVIYLSRVRLIEGTPLLAEEIWLPSSRFDRLLSLGPEQFGDLLYPLYEKQCGQVVVSADETLSVELATSMQARLLKKQPGVPLIVIERLAFDLERQPIEWRRSRGAADRFRYHVEIR
jgi:GntR family transcriptional regulator